MPDEVCPDVVGRAEEAFDSQSGVGFEVVDGSRIERNDGCDGEYVIVTASDPRNLPNDDCAYWLVGAVAGRGPMCGLRTRPDLDDFELEELARDVLDGLYAAYRATGETEPDAA